MRSLHYFHAFTALSRVETLHLDDTKPIGDIKSLPLSTFLPSAEDCSALRDNYVILISRILVKHMAFLQSFSKCVPNQIEHMYSKEIAKKSSVVSECLKYIVCTLFKLMCILRRATCRLWLLTYNGKLSREKLFTNIMVLEPPEKVFSTKFGLQYPFVICSSILQKYSLQNGHFLSIC